MNIHISRWSCHDCNSSLNWRPALSPEDIQTGIMPLDAGPYALFKRRKELRLAGKQAEVT